MILDNIGICIDITLLRTVADDLLKCEKIEKWCLLKLTGRKGFVKGSHCSKFQSVKQLFRNIWDYVYVIHQFTNMEEMARKRMGVVQTFRKAQTIQKVNFVVRNNNNNNNNNNN